MYDTSTFENNGLLKAIFTTHGPQPPVPIFYVPRGQNETLSNQLCNHKLIHRQGVVHNANISNISMEKLIKRAVVSTLR